MLAFSSQGTEGTVDQGDNVEARIETSVRAIGLGSPPVDCHLRAMRVGGRWNVFLWAPNGNRSSLAAWLTSQGAFDRVENSTSSPRVVVAKTTQLPGDWERLIDLSINRTIVVRADGTAMLTLAGPRELISRVFAQLRSDAEADLSRVRLAETSDDQKPRLTPEQRQALEAAYEAGYFDVPREIRLSELAADLGRSQGALSEILRRATRRLIEAQLDQTDQEEEEEEEGSPGKSVGLSFEDPVEWPDEVSGDPAP